MKWLAGNIGKIWVCLLLLVLGPVAAGIPEAEHTLEEKRAIFMDAERALKKGQISKYRRLKASLHDYPLYPYLEYRELRRRLGLLSNEQVEDFLSDNRNTPLADLMRRAWLDQLARQGRWQSYLMFYQPQHSVTRRCHYLRALINTDRSMEAMEQVQSLWLHGYSQPKACDPVFMAWREAGHMTESLIWQRIEMAIEKRQSRLAKYLGAFLPAKDQQWVEDWFQIYRKPERIVQRKRAIADHLYRNKILLYGLKRLSHKDSAAALNAWNTLQQSYDFSPEQQRQAEGIVALALIRDGSPEALSYLTMIEPTSDDVRLLEAGILAAKREGDWAAALRWLLTLPEQERHSERWEYWRARTLQVLGFQKNAESLYAKLARERSYYGFLAADQLGQDYHLEHVPLNIETSKLESLVVKLPGLQRARELYALKRLGSARREWEAVIQSLNPEQLHVAAKLAQGLGWHDRAIFSLARAGYWDDLELRFPLEFRRQVESQASDRELESAWVFAVLRQESAFVMDARSSAGALGLMQLMPRTARQVARGLKHRKLRSHELLQPDTNIRLGTAYLRQVLDQLQQHPVLATAAYNAGPYRVRGWLPSQAMPADIWVEMIPFKETRNYLRRVLAYTVIYEQRLGLKPKRLEERMFSIVAPEILTAGLGSQLETKPDSKI